MTHFLKRPGSPVKMTWNFTKVKSQQCVWWLVTQLALSHADSWLKTWPYDSGTSLLLPVFNCSATESLQGFDTASSAGFSDVWNLIPACLRWLRSIWSWQEPKHLELEIFQSQVVMGKYLSDGITHEQVHLCLSFALTWSPANARFPPCSIHRQDSGTHTAYWVNSTLYGSNCHPCTYFSSSLLLSQVYVPCISFPSPGVSSVEKVILMSFREALQNRFDHLNFILSSFLWCQDFFFRVVKTNISFMTSELSHLILCPDPTLGTMASCHSVCCWETGSLYNLSIF